MGRVQLSQLCEGSPLISRRAGRLWEKEVTCCAAFCVWTHSTGQWAPDLGWQVLTWTGMWAGMPLALPG